MSTIHPDGCDECGELRELYHNESTGLALCEECDKTQDIADVLDAAAFDTAGTIDAYENTNILLEREVAGIKVMLQYLPLTELTGITVEVNGTQMYATVKAEQALDAFHHPCLYLAPAQVAELGIK